MERDDEGASEKRETSAILEDILEAITVCQACMVALTKNMTVNKEEILTVRQDIQALKGRMGEAEKRISQMEDSAHPLKSQVNLLKKTVEHQEDIIDELHNRSRRNNLWLIGVPEKAKGSDPSGYVEKLLKEIMGE